MASGIAAAGYNDHAMIATAVLVLAFTLRVIKGQGHASGQRHMTSTLESVIAPLAIVFATVIAARLGGV